MRIRRRGDGRSERRSFGCKWFLHSYRRRGHEIWGARGTGCRVAIELFPTVITNPSMDDGGDGGSVGLERDIARRVDKVEIRSIE